MPRKSARCADTIPAAPAFSTLAASLFTLLGSLSKAKTLISLQDWTVEPSCRSPAFKSCRLRFFLLLCWELPVPAAAAAAVLAARRAAACVVLLPGAAQQSTKCHPAPGWRACAGMQLALLCSSDTRHGTKINIQRECSSHGQLEVQGANLPVTGCCAVQVLVLEWNSVFPDITNKDSGFTHQGGLLRKACKGSCRPCDLPCRSGV